MHEQLRKFSLPMKKNNQAKRVFSKTKGDDEIIHDVQNWLIQKGFRPYVEHFLLFDSETGKYKGCSRSFTLQQLKGHNVRHPDIFIPNLKLVIEIDGNEKNNIHEFKKTNTDERNRMYKEGGLDLIIITPKELKVLGVTWQDYLKQKLYHLHAIIGSGKDVE